MNKNKFSIVFCATIAAFFCFINCFAGQVQTGDEILQVNKEISFPLKKGEEKTFYLNLKKGEFAELHWSDSLQRFPAFLLASPSGKDLLKDAYVSDSIPFIARESGKYKFVVNFDESENQTEDAKITLSYSNVFELPKTARLKRERKINGYDAKVFNDSETSSTYLIIEKNGKLQEVLKGGSLIGGGFNFADEAALAYSAEGRKSAALMRATIDKTGDGTPDLAVQFFTGGAHCCTDLHFYELGANELRKLKTISAMDSEVNAIGKKTAKGSLILKTGDSTFAYWLTCFACSPIPTVILTYQNGEFRPDLKLMKKPAPSLAILKQRAAKAKKGMNLESYTGEEDSNFLEAFWDEMLDLMYSGNETAAWQYFDLVWDARKPGKEKFKDDFLNRLDKSEFWRMMKQDEISRNQTQK